MGNPRPPRRHRRRRAKVKHICNALERKRTANRGVGVPEPVGLYYRFWIGG